MSLKKKVNIATLRHNNFKDLPSPIFFLSTGRTGTKWFANLFKQQKQLITFHQAVPTLAIQNKFYYNILNDKTLSEKTKYEIGKEIFLAAREEYLLYSYKTQKNFLETNNDMLFFAEVIAKLIPNSKFVHIYRHPGDFVRSGLARGWYQDNIVEQKMIKPNIANWQQLNRIEKIAWLWNESNTFIENFKQKIDKNRIFELNFSSFSIQDIMQLANFIGIKLNEKKINKLKNKKINTQPNPYPKYKDWTEKDKNTLKNICGKLAQKYGYKF